MSEKTLRFNHTTRMYRDKALKELRDKKIKRDFKRLASQKIIRSPKYRRGAILEMLSVRFYLSTDRIGDIVRGK